MRIRCPGAAQSKWQALHQGTEHTLPLRLLHAGSMGSVVGEKLTRLIEYATQVRSCWIYSIYIVYRLDWIPRLDR